MKTNLDNYIGLFLRKRKAYKNVFNTKEGKLVLADIFKLCGYNKQVFVQSDPYATAFNAGRHKVAQLISATLNLTDEEINKLYKHTTEVI